MLILLPSSEGKSAAARGLPVSLADLHFPELNPSRTLVLEALREASAAADAHEVLGVGASLGAEVRRNTALDVEPAAPAHSIYSGVLYDALNYDGMTPAQRRRAREHIVVVSALWGAVRFGDPIPAYRLSMSVTLPGAGRLGSFWKDVLDAPLRAHSEGNLIIDCRSSTYASAWTPPVERTVAVNVFSERAGKRTVVSHFAKHTRGALTRHLLTRRGKAPAGPAQLLAAAREVWTAELEPAAGKKPARLNLILDA